MAQEWSDVILLCLPVWPPVSHGCPSVALTECPSFRCVLGLGKLLWFGLAATASTMELRRWGILPLAPGLQLSPAGPRIEGAALGYRSRQP